MPGGLKKRKGARKQRSTTFTAHEICRPGRGAGRGADPAVASGRARRRLARLGLWFATFVAFSAFVFCWRRGMRLRSRFKSSVSAPCAVAGGHRRRLRGDDMVLVKTDWWDPSRGRADVAGGHGDRRGLGAGLGQLLGSPSAPLWCDRCVRAWCLAVGCIVGWQVDKKTGGA